ncbi:DMT family transporter [Novosphingobium sp.]|uniref:DMT family transporter n=1 Tax=Novosphingobium sp. TaxID=1874826 RepID=UPI00286BA867|nr:DMT family transporter [Novosphingobium sp.]
MRSTETHHPLMPFLAVATGIATFSVMDALMKGASLAVGAYNAMFWRSLVGVTVMLPYWRLRGGIWPRGEALRLHAMRGLTSAFMATTFFYGLKFLPLAEGMAISFIAPLIALYLAAVLLGETIGRRAVFASLLGLAGVVVIAAARLGQGGYDENAAWGIAAILASAVLYAWNLILQKRQALVAGPIEVATFQAVFTSLFLALVAPWLAALPPLSVMGHIGGSALLATISLMLISWGYGRAETQVLLPLEYSAFIWAAIMGWFMFGEGLSLPTIAGAALIVVGCWIAARKQGMHTEQTAL